MLCSQPSFFVVLVLVVVLVGRGLLLLCLPEEDRCLDCRWSVLTEGIRLRFLERCLNLLELFGRHAHGRIGEVLDFPAVRNASELPSGLRLPSEGDEQLVVWDLGGVLGLPVARIAPVEAPLPDSGFGLASVVRTEGCSRHNGARVLVVFDLGGPLRTTLLLLLHACFAVHRTSFW